MKLCVVVPCYNEESMLHESARQLLNVIEELIEQEKISTNSYILFVDDGSSDTTWDIIKQLASKHQYIAGLKLATNVGHQNSLLAGMFHVESDAIVTIDADLQDDVKCIINMVDRFSEGFEVVYGVRNKRKTDTIFKKYSAQLFYILLSWMGAKIVYNHADYRLMSQRAVNELKQFREINLFLRGMIPLLGFKSIQVFYERKARAAGYSKYNIHRMVSFAWQGVTSFSNVPLRIISILGFSVFLATMMMGIWIFGVKYFSEGAVPGWASTVLPIYMLGGIQILCLGVIGEYLGKIYTEVKGRPRFIVEDVVN